jgi:cysteine synthase
MSAPTSAPSKLGLEREIVDQAVLERAIARFRDEGIVLPTFAQLADPSTIPADIVERLAGIDPRVGDPANLFRVHWHNTAAADGSFSATADLPDHVVLGPELTGVEAPIIVLFGDRFPMIDAHKVLAAYACLVARLVTGQFDPTEHRAVWPSTGNYARGGVAISRIMASRGVAVLPENMSRERFEWLERWVVEPGDIIRTPGSESNVKEIYDACAELEADPTNFILNQFCEFANYLVHRHVTGAALERVYRSVAAADGGPSQLAAWVSATGSAGTIAAGDHLKEVFGTKIVAVEALECPTMLHNGFGEHNIQGIGDKHIPLIHNVTNTDVVVGISDQATDELGLAFVSESGRELLRRRGVDEATIASLEHMGFSSICNVLAAIKTAKVLGLGADQAVITVATDGSMLYASEHEALLAERFAGEFGDAQAAAVVARHLDGADVANVEELDTAGRNRIFNLGYFTWVEQQGIDLETFEARRHQSFWDDLSSYVPRWDELIGEFNAATGLA